MAESLKQVVRALLLGITDLKKKLSTLPFEVSDIASQCKRNGSSCLRAGFIFVVVFLSIDCILIVHC